MSTPFSHQQQSPRRPVQDSLPCILAHTYKHISRVSILYIYSLSHTHICKTVSKYRLLEGSARASRPQATPLQLGSYPHSGQVPLKLTLLKLLTSEPGFLLFSSYNKTRRSKVLPAISRQFTFPTIYPSPRFTTHSTLKVSKPICV